MRSLRGRDCGGRSLAGPSEPYSPLYVEIVIVGLVSSQPIAICGTVFPRVVDLGGLRRPSGTQQPVRTLVRAWEGALDDYMRGLIDQNYTTVLAAFDRMSAGNAAQSQAWIVIERAER